MYPTVDKAASFSFASNICNIEIVLRCLTRNINCKILHNLQKNTDRRASLQNQNIPL